MGLSVRYALLLVGVLQLLPCNSMCDAAKVVHMHFKHKMAQRHVLKRDTIETGLQNYLPQFQYFISARIGTPAQDNELLVDTGSSDSYVLATGHCQDTYYAFCEGGLFDASESSSLTELPQMGTFRTSFSGGTGIGGSYFSDTFRFDNATVTDFTMALGTKNRGQFTGLLALGLPANEAAFNGIHKTGPYPNLPEMMVDQGLIDSQSFSVYLDDASSSTGNILFGGYDTAKYSGDLVMLPYMKTWSPSKVTEYAMPFTSIGVKRSQGSQITLTSFEALPAILDSGSPGIYLHKDMIDVIQAELAPLSPDFQNSPHSLSCSLAKLEGAINFGFGQGSNSVVIPVPIAELVLPKYHPDGALKYNSNGKPLCHFGIFPANGITILGQYFMRSAYSFFDLDNLAGGLAPAVFQTSKSNIIEYSSTSSNDRIDASGMSANPSTFTTTGELTTTVQPNPVTHSPFPISFGSLGPLHSTTSTSKSRRTSSTSTSGTSRSTSSTRKTTRVQAQETSKPSSIPSIPTSNPDPTTAANSQSSNKPTSSTTGGGHRQTDTSTATRLVITPFANHLAWIVGVMSVLSSILG